MEKQLDEAISKYFDSLIANYNFSLIKQEAFGLGALKDYENENLYMRIVNDKGIISLEVGPKSNTEQARDIALYKELKEPPKQGCWNLSLQEQAEYLEDNWEWFLNALNEEHQKETLIKLNECGIQRARKILPGLLSSD